MLLRLPQSIGKAKQRVKKYLPKSPQHKKEVILALAKEFDVGFMPKISSYYANGSSDENMVKEIQNYY